MWLYGCVSEDTEILTESGWKNYSQIDIGDRVVTWNKDSDTLERKTVKDKIVTNYSGPMVQIQNQNIDALVTPNHRVYHKYHRLKESNGKRKGVYTDWVVTEAEKIVPSKSIRLPLSSRYIVEHEPTQTGIYLAKLLGYIIKYGNPVHVQKSISVTIKIKNNNTSEINDFEEILNNLPIDVDRYDARSQKNNTVNRKMYFMGGPLIEKIAEVISGGVPDFSLLWKMNTEEKMALLETYMGDSKNNYVRAKIEDKEKIEWLQSLCATIGYIASYRITESIINFSIIRQATTDINGKKIRESKINYDGIIWSISVDNETYVARRNGLIFITGNSGFPKGNLDIGKHLGDPWIGYGTTLKPAWEPIVLASKPLDKLYLSNAEKWKVAGVNIDATRIPSQDGNVKGRWPSNLIIDEQIGNKLDKITGNIKSRRSTRFGPGKSVGNGITLNRFYLHEVRPGGYNDDGGASKFFYVLKANQKDRGGKENIHPTVKPLQLCEYLAKMIKPPFDDAKIIIPFSGSGSEMIGAMRAGWKDITGIEIESSYIKIAKSRIDTYLKEIGNEEN
jgi:hypothetical protein